MHFHEQPDNSMTISTIVNSQQDLDYFLGLMDEFGVRRMYFEDGDQFHSPFCWIDNTSGYLGYVVNLRSIWDGVTQIPLEDVKSYLQLSTL